MKEILRKYWGYEAFREKQEEIIASVLEGKDTLAILPTGGGKSICFQVPALAVDGLCLVISPLIALMKDQVENLRKKDIPALSIYSGMSFIEVKRTLENALHGNYKFLYVSPERLESSFFLEYLPSLNINLIAVDEAHCISQWGYDFRPPYLRVADIREYFPDIPVLALTASATKEVQDDIEEKLLFREGNRRFQKSFERANLSYSVLKVEAKQPKLLDILKKVEGCAIVYCRSRKRTHEIADLLTTHGISADHYHAGLAGEVRNEKQEKWIKDEVRVMVCTNAFGMGIDKPDVRLVVHYDVPEALEYYYQEAGRAGRDEKKAYATLLYNDNDIIKIKEQAEQRFPSKELVREVYKALVNYLQVPSDSGEGIYYDFDIMDFSEKFKVDAFTAGYCIKVLEQEEIITYTEQLFLPSTVVFTTTRHNLEEFQKEHPKLENIIKGLLRSYGGVIDFPSSVNEMKLAKFVRKPIEEVKAGLALLDAMGIINYVPQKDKPQIQFCSNRVKVSDLKLDEAAMLERKDAYMKRLEAMLNYIGDESTCRSKQIGNYFYDKDVKDCGVCDNCQKKKSTELSAKEFDEIRLAIFYNVSSRSISFSDLLRNINKHEKRHIWQVLNFLQEEKKVRIDDNGLIAKGL